MERNTHVFDACESTDRGEYPGGSTTTLLCKVCATSDALPVGISRSDGVVSAECLLDHQCHTASLWLSQSASLTDEALTKNTKDLTVSFPANAPYALVLASIEEHAVVESSPETPCLSNRYRCGPAQRLSHEPMEGKTMKQTTGSLPESHSDVSLRSQHEQQPQMTMGMVRDVLQERGYAMVSRFEHVHATKAGDEWHLCLMADIAALSPAQFLAALEDALANSLAH
jgi:hypothetical protein